MDRIFDLPILLGLLGGAIVASALGFAVGLTYQPATAVKRAGEAFLTCFLGGFLAHGFVTILLDLGNDSEGAGLLVGWAFFGIPGLVDTGAAVAGLGPFLTTPDRLLGLAAIVGATMGALSGAYRVYKWNGWGIFQFLLDATWGLLGTLLGTLLNLGNSIGGKRLLPRTPAEGNRGERLGVTVFEKGFATAKALTQGATVSNLTEAEILTPGPGDTKIDTPLFEHEKTHVLQNRLFGPFFTLTYLAWMVLLFVPALIGEAQADATEKGGRVYGWCYLSNPWEVWGYHVEGQPRVKFKHGKRSWSGARVFALAIPLYAAFGLAAAVVTTNTLLT